MTHLIWNILNLTIVVFFIYITIGFIFKGKRIFNPKIKAFSIFIMIIGIVQIVSAKNLNEKNNRITISENYINQNNLKAKRIILEDNWTFDIEMLVMYLKDQDKIIPVESKSYLNGLMSGFDWEFYSIATEYLDTTKQTKFEARGILKWKLFGVNFYSQSKRFSGVIK